MMKGSLWTRISKLRQVELGFLVELPTPPWNSSQRPPSALEFSFLTTKSQGPYVADVTPSKIVFIQG